MAANTRRRARLRTTTADRAFNRAVWVVETLKHYLGQLDWGKLQFGHDV